ncbi:hypothetical protein [Alicyclobacillus tolerans]|uniref:Restriction endonuclease Mrr n=1 Tax=Alicyclobacillus tolerans TaxID=90970 RepID=A0ABT9LZJ7_9BACL|nr:hypothetical protein [Alicyclobacillus tengchongensis]MDP9729682.1 restriction endonuclease Mrr [Alicyclobacillus tengchongensis]
MIVARAYGVFQRRRVVLVSGKELAELMIDHGVGVTPFATYDIKKLDQDYFMDE